MTNGHTDPNQTPPPNEKDPVPPIGLEYPGLNSLDPKHTYTLRDYYELAERRFGELDTHAARYKHWIALVITACLVAAYQLGSRALFDIRLYGILTLIAVALAEQTPRSVAALLVRYCKDLDDLMIQANGGDLSDEREKEHLEEQVDIRFSYRLSLRWGAAWRNYIKSTGAGFLRPGLLVPYLIAGVIVFFGAGAIADYHVEKKESRPSVSHCCCCRNGLKQPQPASKPGAKVARRPAPKPSAKATSKPAPKSQGVPKHEFDTDF